MKSSIGRFFLAGVMGMMSLLPVAAQEAVVAPPVGALSGGLLSPLTAPQYTKLSPSGALLGTISRPGSDGSLRSIPNLEVSLIAAGQIVARVATNADGDFAFASVGPGLYTIVASNPKDLVVFPLTVGASDGGEVTPILLVTASPIAPTRRQAMLAAVLGGPMGYPTLPSAGVVESRNVLGSYEISIAPTGELVGRLGVLGTPMSQVDMSQMIVRVMREDSIMGESSVASDGRFAIAGVSPGPAAFFAFGPNGFVAIGIQLVPRAVISASVVQEPESLVSLRAGSANLNVEISPIQDVIAGVSVPGDSFSGPVGGPLSPPAGGFGGAGAGGGFGGGGAGGGLGASGLMGLGAAALAAAALASSDDDDNNFVPAAASPAQ